MPHYHLHHVTVQGQTDVDLSVGGWTISDNGGWADGIGGSRSVVSFDNGGDGPLNNGGDGDGDGTTVQAAAGPASMVRSLRSISMSTSASYESKSIFELSRRFIGLALCSSGRTVVPVRLGRAVVEATIPLKASSPVNRNGPARPAPPSEAATGSARNVGAARRISPCAAAGVATIPAVRRRRSLGPASPTHCAARGGGDGGGDTASASTGLNLPPNEIDLRNKLDKEPTERSTLPHSPSATHAGVDIAGTSLAENANNSDQDAGSVGDGCSRGRRCGVSPTRDMSASSERLGSAAEIGALLAKYRRMETYNCPVSPFSSPPSWAEIPPVAAMEPPGFPPSQPPPESTTVVEQGQLGGGDSCMSPQVKKEAAKTSVGRPVENTVFQKIASGRRASFGWGWKRPPGDRGRRRKRNGLSPRERELWKGINLGSVYPPTS